MAELKLIFTSCALLFFFTCTELAADQRGAAHLHFEEIEAHVEKFTGKINKVCHELSSLNSMPLDVMITEPTREFPYRLLVTSGIAANPMNIQKGIDEHKLIELIMVLPKEWKITSESSQDESKFWPVNLLKFVGRFPHKYKTWIGLGHTLMAHNPPKPIANTGFFGVMISPPYVLSPDFFQLKLKSKEIITFYMVVPLYLEEIELVKKKGHEEVERRLVDGGHGFVINPNRKNVASLR